MERLNTILRQQLPAVSREVMKSATASTAINKANVGRMMALHARNVKALGKKMLQQGKETVHEQARVGKSGITGHSPYEKVISTEPTYKRNEDVVVERLLKERQEKQRAWGGDRWDTAGVWPAVRMTDAGGNKWGVVAVVAGGADDGYRLR